MEDPGDRLRTSADHSVRKGAIECHISGTQRALPQCSRLEVVTKNWFDHRGVGSSGNLVCLIYPQLADHDDVRDPTDVNGSRYVRSRHGRYLTVGVNRIRNPSISEEGSSFHTLRGPCPQPQWRSVDCVECWTHLFVAIPTCPRRTKRTQTIGEKGRAPVSVNTEPSKVGRVVAGSHPENKPSIRSVLKYGRLFGQPWY